MRTILITLLMLTFKIGFSQLEANNFIVTNEGRVNWQKIYENESVTFDDLVNTVKSNTVFSDISVLDNKITFLSNKIPIDVKGAGFSAFTTSFYAIHGIKAYFTIDYKPGRYRITAVNISTEVPVLDLLTPKNSKYEFIPIEESVGNGKGLKKGFIKKESIILNYALESQFVIVKGTSDEW